jgi:uncharacterized protein (TIGR02680 family)
VTADAGHTAELPLPRRERWELLRAGLQNIWEYDDQRFVFHHGRLLLRGRNESGKTKALEVLLPFLLDADLSPQRLDPFGSMARPMRWNLLNESNPEQNTRVAYVWLELGRLGPDGPELRTVGAGLRAKRSTPAVAVWYFITGLRVDRDFNPIGPGRRPLVQSRLEEALGERGQVFSRASDYRQAINRELFEMPGDQYRALIEALLQLRRPQLSKQLRPEELSRILSASLPPLERGVVDPLAEGFERLDRHREEREVWQQTLSAVERFTGVYRGFAEILARRQALELTRAESAHHKARAELRHWEQQVEQASALRQQLARRRGELESEQRSLAEKVATLKASEEYRSVQELARAEEAQGEAEAQQARADRRQQQDVAALELQQDRQRAEQARADRARAERDSDLAACQRAAAAADLSPGHRGVERQLREDRLDAARGTLDSLLEERRRAGEQLEAEQRRVLEAGQELARIRQRVEDAGEAAREAAEALAGAERAAEAARGAFERDVRQWLDGLRALALREAEREELLEHLPHGVRPGVERAASRQRQALHGELARAEAGARALEQELQELRRQREELEAATHSPPEAPGWRGERPAGRPGAPFYLLVDFREADPGIRSGLEAALEAGGLLDAWVTPGGKLLDPQTHDVLLRPGPEDGRPAGPTLAAALEPGPDAGVPRRTVERVLSAIALVTDAAEPPAPGPPCWVATDGRFQVGPLRGCWRKEAPAYIGATARERARQRRLAELAAQQDRLQREQSEARRQGQQVRQRLERLDAELRAFPDPQPLREARAAVDASARQLASQQGRLQEAREAEARQRDELARRVEQRDHLAARLGLSRWAEEAGKLARLTRDYRDACRDLLRSAGQELECRRQLQGRQEEVRLATERLEQARVEARRALQATERAAARAAALRAVVGESHTVVLEQLKQASDRQQAAGAELSSVLEAEGDAREMFGNASASVRGAAAGVERTDADRQQAGARFQRMAGAGLLDLLELAGEGEPAGWSHTETLLLARRTDEQTAGVTCDQEALDRAENRVTEHHQQLVRDLRPEVRVIQQREDGIPAYQAHWTGRQLDLLALAGELRQELATHDRLLGEEERELFESFLTGETHEHLRARLRQAHELVGRMNEQLRRRPTASGMQIRLSWSVRDDAPAGARQALELMLRSPALLSDADQDALREFMRRRLEDARVADGPGSMQERMGSVMDYRDWHAFVVEFRSDSSDGWRKLTRRAHAAGSGGQKAVVLHLPLFAAAAAFYTSAAPTAPRLIVLDEAFAGIDRATRAELMGLLAEFDLDFLMTSYEEWGFYEQLDGLATYHLSRESGYRGVHTDWFIWNGGQIQEMSA